MEFYIKNNDLISKKEWVNLISSLENNFNSLETNLERSKRRLKESLFKAVEKRKDDSLGIFLSGGVDSSLLVFIAKELGLKFKCFTVGFQEKSKKPEDLEYSERLAEELNLDLISKVYGLNEVEGAVKEVVKILKTEDSVKVGIGVVVYLGLKLAKENEVKVLLGGLGVEETLCGYMRHKDVFSKEGFERVHKECWRGLKEMYGIDLTRDASIVKSMNMDVRTPFLDRDFIIEAMKIHPMLKISNDQNKIVLREMAKDIGLNYSIAFRKKVAAQYGSRIDKAIDKLARKNGFKFKKDWLNHLMADIKSQPLLFKP